jgi:hypothetical protein
MPVQIGMRPFFPFYGSKWNIARHYPRPLLGRPVVEPFAGSAGYATFYGCQSVILHDTDPVIAGVWSFLLRVQPAEIMRLPELPEVGDCVDNYSLPQEARWLIGFWLNRGSAQPKKSRTAYSARTDRSQLNWSLRAKERIASQLAAIRGWKIQNSSYRAASNINATWFIDPPYGDKGKFYRTRFSDFGALSDWCQQLRGRIIVCERDDATWLPFTPIGSFKSSRGRAREAVFHKDTLS